MSEREKLVPGSYEWACTQPQLKSCPSINSNNQVTEKVVEVKLFSTDKPPQEVVRQTSSKITSAMKANGVSAEDVQKQFSLKEILKTHLKKLKEALPNYPAKERNKWESYISVLNSSTSRFSSEELGTVIEEIKRRIELGEIFDEIMFGSK